MNLRDELLKSTSASKYKDWVPQSTKNARPKEPYIPKMQAQMTQEAEELLAISIGLMVSCRNDT